MCLDNHQIDGDRKFVLGRKSIFTQDWDQLPKAETVFVCESVIDYLSVKTLESLPPPGMALLGNRVNLTPSLIGNARTILSALDDDRGGYSAMLDIQERFPDKEIKMYDLEGHKDPNELLMAVRSGKGRKLSPERKLQLYQEFLQARNKSELARQWGVDRSYMYEIVRECEKILLDTFSGRTPGRKPAGKPPTLKESWQRIEELEEKYEKEATEREKLYCRGEFLQLRLKWAEIESAKLRGEPVDDSTGPKKKTQIKKKKKRRRSRRWTG
ncbi:MAG: toprim domain-containing protein [bacterium]|nr:toprim domain-containing protein [bacterium]